MEMSNISFFAEEFIWIWKEQEEIHEKLFENTHHWRI